MTLFGMTLSGFTFAALTFALFAWGLWVGLKGAFAEAPEFKQGGHAPGGAGTYDPRCAACAEARTAA
jgi:hypothetical protein